MSLDQLFKTMHSDFEDFTEEADKFISKQKEKVYKKQIEMEQTKKVFYRITHEHLVGLECDKIALTSKNFDTLEEAEDYKEHIGIDSNPWIRSCEHWETHYDISKKSAKIYKVTEIKEEI